MKLRHLDGTAGDLQGLPAVTWQSRESSMAGTENLRGIVVLMAEKQGFPWVFHGFPVQVHLNQLKCLQL